jgi:hypothetical protein
LSPEQTAAVVELAELRHRAKIKFSDADRLFLTRRGYEQASGEALAAWKMDCLRQRWPQERPLVVDLCCGVGGDLRVFGREYPCVGVERDPAVAHFAEENLQQLSPSDGLDLPPRAVICAAVETLLQPRDATGEGRPALLDSDKPAETCAAAIRAPHDESRPLVSPEVTAGSMLHWPERLRDWVQRKGLGGRRVVWHMDPDRRDAAGRHTRWEDLSPGPELVEDLLDQWGPGVVKLAPATEIPAAWREMGHWPWLGWARECKQLLGWFGWEPSFPPGQRSVVVWDRERAAWRVWQGTCPSGGERARVGIAAEPQRYLFEPHAAVYAARLADALAEEQGWLRLIGSDYWTADTLAPSGGELFAAFEVLEVMPLRLPTLRAWLEERSAMVTEVKTRAVSEQDANRLKPWVGRRLGGDGGPLVSLMLYVAGSGLMGRKDAGQREGDWVVASERTRAVRVGGRGAALRVAVCRRVTEAGGGESERS